MLRKRRGNHLEGCGLNDSDSTKINSENFFGGSGDISAKFCTSENFPLY